jgi:hypothetical protein
MKRIIVSFIPFTLLIMMFMVSSPTTTSSDQMNTITIDTGLVSNNLFDVSSNKYLDPGDGCGFTCDSSDPNDPDDSDDDNSGSGGGGNSGFT